MCPIHSTVFVEWVGNLNPQPEIDAQPASSSMIAILNIGQLVTLTGSPHPRVGAELNDLALIKTLRCSLKTGIQVLL